MFLNSASDTKPSLSVSRRSNSEVFFLPFLPLPAFLVLLAFFGLAAFLVVLAAVLVLLALEAFLTSLYLANSSLLSLLSLFVSSFLNRTVILSVFLPAF